jgi:hypothetical protein
VVGDRHWWSATRQRQKLITCSKKGNAFDFAATVSEPHSGTAPITPLSCIPLSSANNRAQHSLSRGDPFQDPCPSAHQSWTEVTAAAGPIAARFKVCKVRIASTGWIELQDHSIPLDAAAGEHDSVGILHSLETFFGPGATKPGLTVGQNTQGCWVHPSFFFHLLSFSGSSGIHTPL